MNYLYELMNICQNMALTY